MSNAVLLDAIKKCRANHAYWTKTVLVQRPNAAQEIAPYLSGGGDAFSGLLDGFSSRLEAMSARPRISATLPTSQLQLICIHAQTIYVNMQSHTNGLEWLLQNTGFANSISCLDQLLKSLERTDKKENDALLDVAQARLSSELKTFQDGSAYFANLLQRRETVEGVLEKLEGAEDEIDKTLDQLTKSAAAANVAIAASNKGVETAASELSGKIDEQKAAL